MAPKVSAACIESYTVEEVDDLIVKFERCAARVSACWASKVRLRAAERDLLHVAEALRDLLLHAVKGDKNWLVEVFGDAGSSEESQSCPRLHRLRLVIGGVELSEMHATDPRWPGLVKAMEMIEDVMKQMGMFKPWKLVKRTLVAQEPRRRFVGKAGLPGDLQQLDLPSRCPVAMGMNFFNVRTLKQGHAAAAPVCLWYSVMREKAIFLPRGMLLQPNVVFENSKARGYWSMIRAKVLKKSPVSLPEGLLFSVSPPLAPGMLLDESTGVILVQPKFAVAWGSYRITAMSDAGLCVSTELRLCVRGGLLEPPHYPAALEYRTGEPVELLPIVEEEFSEWGCCSDLPAGLDLDPRSGVISGTPLELVEDGFWTVSAGNDVGEAAACLTFSVVPGADLGCAKEAAPALCLAPRLPVVSCPSAPPLLLEYSAEKEATGDVVLKPLVVLETPMIAGRWQRLRAKLLRKEFAVGTAEMSFSITPALPEGCLFSRSTGVVVVRRAEAAAELQGHRVTVWSDGGEASADLRSVARHLLPLSYPLLQPEYSIGEVVELVPAMQASFTSWSVSPPLPPGLELDESTGIISGKLARVVRQGTWVVTARCGAREANVALAFSVRKKALNLGTQRCRCLVCTRGAGAGATLAATRTLRGGGGAGAAAEVRATLGEEDFLEYDLPSDAFAIGEHVELEPSSSGGRSGWAVEPALPAGLVLDTDTGRISGTPLVATDATTYVVTASSKARSEAAAISFAVYGHAPFGLSYPEVCPDYTVGQELVLRPELLVGKAEEYEVEPPLPQGLKLDAATGVIAGVLEESTEVTAYTVTAKSRAGDTEAVLAFKGWEPIELATGVSQRFAAMVDGITSLGEMLVQPPVERSVGDWMVWMAHRAWLDDPTLADVNFNNLCMPPASLEPRIVTKLMRAMAHNTHITSLQLAHCNLEDDGGLDLAQALASNTTLRVLNVESNSLGPGAVQRIAEALQGNAGAGLESLRVGQQNGAGSFGLAVEEAVAGMMQRNLRICRLGFACADANCRAAIDSALCRNKGLAWRCSASAGAEGDAGGEEGKQPVAAGAVAGQASGKGLGSAVQRLSENWSAWFSAGGA